MKNTFFIKIRLWSQLSAIATCLITASLLGFAGKFAWWLDLFSHFRVQYTFSLGFLFLLFIIGRKKVLCLVIFPFLILNAWLLSPYVPFKPQTPLSDPSAVKILCANVHTTNTNTQSLIKLLLQTKPDLVILEEINQSWVDAMKPLLNTFQHFKVVPRSDNFGIGIFSTVPMDKISVLTFGEAGVPTLYARITLQGKTLSLIATHPVPPGNARMSGLRDNQLDELTPFINGISEPLLLLGDLNVTPWSYSFKMLIQKTTLQDSSLKRGIQPTWPTFLWPMRIPIDHCLHSPHIQIINRKVESDIGSDHLPLSIEFTLI